MPEPLHLPVRRPPSPHRRGIHRLLQRKPASSGNRGHSGLRPGLAEGDSSCDQGRPDQGRCRACARRASPRLSDRRVAQVLPQTLWPVSKRARSSLVMPTIPDSGIDRARRVPFGRRLILRESSEWTSVPPLETNCPKNPHGWSIRGPRGTGHEEPLSATPGMSKRPSAGVLKALASRSSSNAL